MKKLITLLIIFVTNTSAQAQPNMPDSDEHTILVCGAIGTRSEGFYTATIQQDQFLEYANCSDDEATKPVCVNVGTRSEGWQLRRGLQYDKCKDKIAACRGDGSRSEGWSAITIDHSSMQLVGFWNCSR